MRSTAIIVDAQAELAAAQTAGGDKHAPFEYVAAEEYLHKAREEQSYADFEVAVKDGRKAYTCARAARQRAEAATRATIGAEETSPRKLTVCRAGLDRGPGSLAPSEEPAARVGSAGGEPADPAAARAEPADPVGEPATSGAEAPAKKDGGKPKVTAEPEEPAPLEKRPAEAHPQPEEPLPEGDD